MDHVLLIEMPTYVMAYLTVFNGFVVTAGQAGCATEGRDDAEHVH